MDFMQILIAAALLSYIGLGAIWIWQLGLWRGSAAILCRTAWTLPILLSFFPETVSEEIPGSITSRPLHILVDDSASMQRRSPGEMSSRYAQAEKLVASISESCVEKGCVAKVTKLSESDDATLQNMTPLSTSLEPWLYRAGTDPWILITDGGDGQPAAPWQAKLKGLGAPQQQGRTPRGFIAGFAPDDEGNVWLEGFEVAPFSFEGKPLPVDVAIRRVKAMAETQRIQVQILNGDKVLATANAQFAAEEVQATASAVIPSLPRGQQMLTIKVLPTAREKDLWDNSSYAQVDVLPNTVGVLHLLGSPSWDGRFLRRYLKSEPKYDLISFFILRDPWDSQQANERELSLIPFPVERLFREELPNFRVCIIQNFALFQFLLPEYQENLVRFVREGGGLLFIGGPRALRSGDLASSPLRSILPFAVEGEGELGIGSSMPMTPLLPLGSEGIFTDSDEDVSGPQYDPATKFKIKLAKPEAHKRALANVYDDWERMADALMEASSFTGLHHTERVTFKKGEYTPLLFAQKPDGKDLPLVVASYPGKGRALWVFSDSLWRLAMGGTSGIPRETYSRFMEAAMTWLLRQDLKKPLVARSFHLRSDNPSLQAQTLWKTAPLPRWDATIYGPATRYFNASSDWRIHVCGVNVPMESVAIEKSGADEWQISGRLSRAISGGERCTLEIEGNHAAFGSVKASITTVYPETFTDDVIGSSPHKLVSLAKITGAELSLPPEDREAALGAWLEKVVGQGENFTPSKTKTSREFYWVLTKPWFWLLLMFLPLEVLLRRWHELVTMGRRQTFSALSK